MMLLWLVFFLFILGAADALADNRFSVGVERLNDRYKEPSATVDVSTNYGSATASYEHSKNGFFSAIDGRYSSGKEDYKSDSGTLNGEPSLETEFRLRAGFDIPTTVWHGHLMPYMGVGWRYYFDQGKGLATNTGSLAYDRHISQFYIPVGGTWRITSGNWIFSPNLEGDMLFYGQVNTHFQPIDPSLAPSDQEPNITNQQHTGWGLRGEFMSGQQYKSFGWEAGPFVRYWHISDSNCKVTANSTASGTCLLEPENTRLQAGAALRLNF
ncbi:MAG: hypothetical protein KGJ06_00475 [Pseudomonadota bacterium]|nr:hypothetical protein [Pseudomonadota bacterium]